MYNNQYLLYFVPGNCDYISLLQKKPHTQVLVYDFILYPMFDLEIIKRLKLATILTPGLTATTRLFGHYPVGYFKS